MRQINKKLYTRLVAFAAAFLLLLPLFPAARAAEASGDCGNGLSWSLSSGTLTISGSGAMPDYQEFTPAPWHSYAGSIRSVRVESGVTYIGDFSFFCLENVTAVTLASSVTEIGDFAFFGCASLELLDLGSGLKILGDSAFAECSSLMSVQLPSSLQTLKFHAFYRCEGLMSITVPSSVTNMESTVFAYCTNLRSASIQANISHLPLWTFYGCYELSSVTLASSITTVGTYAFHDSKISEDNYVVSDTVDPVRSSITSSTTTQENGQITVTDNHYTEQSGSSVNVQTTTQGLPGDSETSVEVDAVLENQEGWSHLEEQVQGAVDSAGGERVDVNVNLKGDAEVSGKDLGRFAGENVDITIHTQQGAHWHVNGQNISADQLQESYDLSFTLRPLTDPTDQQIEAVGIGTSFVVVFDADIDFKVEVELPLGASLARNTAVFFAPGEEGFDRMQAVVIDGEGIAHFYLGDVQAKTEYLIGINIPNRESDTGISDAIIPEQLHNEYPAIEQVEQVEYVVTGRKSSWGMNLGQVTGILAAVMIGSVVIVGVVMYIIFKQKLKKGYVPDMRYADEVPESKSRKRK